MVKSTTKKKIWNVVFSILSLSLTAFLLYSIVDHIQLLNSEDKKNDTIIIVFFEAIALFVLAFFGKGSLKSLRYSDADAAEKIKKESDILKRKLRTRINLNAEYEPSIIKKCPSCHLENPSHAKVCLGCGHRLF